jgi:hypothetical protein
MYNINTSTVYCTLNSQQLPQRITVHSQTKWHLATMVSLETHISIDSWYDNTSKATVLFPAHFLWLNSMKDIRNTKPHLMDVTSLQNGATAQKLQNWINCMMKKIWWLQYSHIDSVMNMNSEVCYSCQMSIFPKLLNCVWFCMHFS